MKADSLPKWMFNPYQGTIWRNGECIPGTKAEYAELIAQANAAADLQAALIAVRDHWQGRACDAQWFTNIERALQSISIL